MLYWLIQHQAPFFEKLHGVSTGDSRVFLTGRTAVAAIVSFLLAWWFGPAAIHWLKGRFRERIDSASQRLNELHAAKQATPTMGGLFLVAAILGTTLLCGDLQNVFVQQAFVLLLATAVIGGIDDWVKIRTRRRGLSVRQKLAGQLAVAGLIGVWLYVVQRDHPDGLQLFVPFSSWSMALGGLYITWAMFVMVGASNGVNLTDGLDGLAGGCLVFAGSAFLVLCYLSGHRLFAEYLSIPHIVGAGELSVVFGAMVGSLLGFLWYNCFPAAVFMGDTGSLPLGAFLGYGALVIRQEFLLVVIGGIFVIETLSVMAQVASFKLTGKRVLACSPLHNHYLFRGEHEARIVVRFWIVSALLALLAVASLKFQ